MPSQESKTLIAMSLQLGVSVAIPTALLAYGGHWLDVRFGNKALFLMIGLGLALVISFTLVWQIVKVATHKLQKPPISENPHH